MKRLVVALVLVALALPACSSSGGSPNKWVDQSVKFTAGGMTIYATYRHPTGGSAPLPAALLIAGSGPTDRNGNSPAIPGEVNTLQTVADWLSTAGVATLRYDKLGSGRTGAGAYAKHPENVGMAVFNAEAAAALNFLAAQRRVDRSRLAVFGHSEGALFALLLATGQAGAAPPVHALGLLEPLSVRYLDVINEQVTAQVDAQQKAGQLTAAVAGQVRTALAGAIATLRSTGTVTSNLPFGLSTLLSPATAMFLSQADKFDPGQLASTLPRGMPVLVSCSDADIQVSCTDVSHLVAGLTAAGTGTQFVRLTGVDHVLKEDASRTGNVYGNFLPFSTQLQAAIATFAARL